MVGLVPNDDFRTIILSVSIGCLIHKGENPIAVTVLVRDRSRNYYYTAIRMISFAFLDQIQTIYCKFIEGIYKSPKAQQPPPSAGSTNHVCFVLVRMSFDGGFLGNTILFTHIIKKTSALYLRRPHGLLCLILICRISKLK